MKDLTVSATSVVIIAVGIGLVFHWLYPRVDISAELMGLFVFIAAILKLTGSKTWSLLRNTRKSPNSEETK